MRSLKYFLTKGLLFLLIFGMILSGLNYVFIPKTGTFARQIRVTRAFYRQPKNTLDVIYIGASTFIRGISPLSIYEKYGFTGYVRAAPAQMPLVSFYVFQETLKYQNPKLVVLDASLLFKDISLLDEKEEWVRLAIDPLRLSADKLGMIMEINTRTKKQSVISYLFPFLRYHSRWDQLTTSDFTKIRKDVRDNRFKGFRPALSSEYLEPFWIEESESDYESLAPSAMDYYQRIIQMSQDKNIEVILLTIPRVARTSTEHELIQSFANENKVPFLDFSTDENLALIGLDRSRDFEDSNHLNILGGLKVTLALADYIHKNYPMASKRTDPEYSTWEEDLEIYDLWMENNIPLVSQPD